MAFNGLKSKWKDGKLGRISDIYTLVSVAASQDMVHFTQRFKDILKLIDQ